MEIYDRDVFMRLLASRGISEDPFYVRIGSSLVPMKVYLPKIIRGIVFSFHGAVDRKTREVPAFNPFFRKLGARIAEISVSDPSLLVGDGFSMSWYAGHDGFDTQGELRALFSDIVEVLSPDRLYFAGSSGGGFAALYFSWWFNNSVAIVAVPQTRIQSYYKGHRSRYLQGCWPGHKRIPDSVTHDLCKLYGARMDNHVIYLQSPGDHFHFKNHAIPFCSVVSDHSGSRFLFDCRTWGRLGHSGSIPRKAITDFLRAAISSPLGAMDDILMEFERLQGVVPRPSQKDVASISAAYSAADLAMAKILTRHHLELSSEGRSQS